jgi:hypothetical protein
MQLSPRNLQYLKTSAPAGTQYPHFLGPDDCERYRITVRLLMPSAAAISAALLPLAANARARSVSSSFWVGHGCAIAVILGDLPELFILLDRFLKLNKIRTFVFVHDA